MGKWFKVLLISFFISLLSINLFASDKNADEFYQTEQAFEAYKFAEAEQGYRSSLVKYQKNVAMASYIENQIAKCLRYQKKTEAAVEQYRKVKKDYPDSPFAGDAQEAVARTYYENRNYEKAGPEFEKVGDEAEAQAQAQQSQSKVKADAEGKGNQNKNITEKKNHAYGYAAYSYKMSKNDIKAALSEMKWKKENSDSNKERKR